MATVDDSGKLLYWILTALLGVAMTGLGWYARTLDARLTEINAHVEAYSARELARADTLTQTSAARWERLSVLEARVASIEPRVNDVASRAGTLEARVPLVESKLSSADARLARIEEKLDRILNRGSGR